MRGLVNFYLKRVVYVIVYVFYFLWVMIMVNLDVVYRVFYFKRLIRLGIVYCKIIFKINFGKFLLVNLIIFMLGMIIFDVDGDDYFIYWIWVLDEVFYVESEEVYVEKVFENIIRFFEKFLKVIFG